jgi:hypothetical protein
MQLHGTHTPNLESSVHNRCDRRGHARKQQPLFSVTANNSIHGNECQRRVVTPQPERQFAGGGAEKRANEGAWQESITLHPRTNDKEKTFQQIMRCNVAANVLKLEEQRRMRGVDNSCECHPSAPNNDTA